MRASVVTVRDNEERQKDEKTDTTKVYVNVRGGCMWFSARWMISLAGMVEL